MPFDSTSTPNSNSTTSSSHPPQPSLIRRISYACLGLAFIVALLLQQRQRQQSLSQSDTMHFQNPFKSSSGSSTSTSTSHHHHLPRPNGKVNIVYFTNWSIYGRKYRPQDIPAQHVTRELGRKRCNGNA